jgi:hypothetical protein
MSDETPDQNTKQVDRGKCGIVMPISPTDGYLPEHWLDVLAILKAVATDTGFNPLLVSDATTSVSFKSESFRISIPTRS